jgi:protein-disulfide isomerase
MNRRTFVLGAAALSVAAFGIGAGVYEQTTTSAALAVVAGLTRPHSPVIGPAEAKVTITEFFDPSCEACRAFYPIVKQIMDMHKGNVRLVMRYAAFHKGSDQAVRILETARLQEKFVPVLEALLEKQPEWAMHDGPDLDKAWEIAGSAGLDVAKAKTDAQSAEITAVLEQDMADGAAAKVQQTPTFFVNGKPLTTFGPQELYDLVTSEVERLKTSP